MFHYYLTRSGRLSQTPLILALLAFVSLHAQAALAMPNQQEGVEQQVLSPLRPFEGYSWEVNDAVDEDDDDYYDCDLDISLTLDPSVIAEGFAQNGQNTLLEPGQSPSLISSNNYINFCATTNQPLTNGRQLAGGSCNPAPMGSIPSSDNMSSSKFIFPTNFGRISANTPFTVSVAVHNLEVGNIVNSESNYLSAPQQLNEQGLVMGYAHVVIEKLTSLTQDTPTDPTKFAYFKGLRSDASLEDLNDGIQFAEVTDGLPAGDYRASAISSAANHQPVLAPVLHHGSLNDVIYFTVVDGTEAV